MRRALAALCAAALVAVPAASAHPGHFAHTKKQAEYDAIKAVVTAALTTGKRGIITPDTRAHCKGIGKPLYVLKNVPHYKHFYCVVAPVGGGELHLIYHSTGKTKFVVTQAPRK